MTEPVQVTQQCLICNAEKEHRIHAEDNEVGHTFVPPVVPERCKHCGGTRDSRMPLSGSGSRCFDKWHELATVATGQEESCGTAPTVSTLTSEVIHPIANNASPSEGALLPDAEWNNLSPDSQHKLQTWFRLATERLQLILDEPVATGETPCSYCGVLCTPNVTACAGCAAKYLADWQEAVKPPHASGAAPQVASDEIGLRARIAELENQIKEINRSAALAKAECEASEDNSSTDIFARNLQAGASDEFKRELTGQDVREAMIALRQIGANFTIDKKWLEPMATALNSRLVPVEQSSRSVQRRVALQKGEAIPTFEPQEGQ